MNAQTDAITFTLPHAMIPDVMAISASLLDRMHHLLERNADGTLTDVEREEAATLVEMAQFSQLLATSAQRQLPPTGTP
jgi:hypothetical protein